MAIFPKRNFTLENQLKTLAMEQALADILYESTGSLNVYKMSFENLCDNIELFNMAKKFPTEERTFSIDGKEEPISISAKQKPKIFKIQKSPAFIM